MWAKDWPKAKMFSEDKTATIHLSMHLLQYCYQSVHVQNHLESISRALQMTTIRKDMGGRKRWDVQEISRPLGMGNKDVT